MTLDVPDEGRTVLPVEGRGLLLPPLRVVVVVVVALPLLRVTVVAVVFVAEPLSEALVYVPPNVRSVVTVAG